MALKFKARTNGEYFSERSLKILIPTFLWWEPPHYGNREKEVANFDLAAKEVARKVTFKSDFGEWEIQYPYLPPTISLQTILQGVI